MASELAPLENEFIQDNMIECVMLEPYISVKEEPTTNYEVDTLDVGDPFSALSCFNPGAIKVEVSENNAYSSNIKDTVKEESEESSCSTSACLDGVKIKEELMLDEDNVELHTYENYMTPLGHEVNGDQLDVKPTLPMEFKIEYEGEKMCFVSGDTLQAVDPLCTKVYSSSLCLEDDLQVESVGQDEEYSGNLLEERRVRRGRPRKGERQPRVIPVLKKVPTISIDKTDGCQMYLSPESLGVEIVSSKSSEMNVMVPKGNGDFVMKTESEDLWPRWASYRLRNSTLNQRQEMRGLKRKTELKGLKWIKQQNQKVEQHILEVRTQKALHEQRFQSSSTNTGEICSPNIDEDTLLSNLIKSNNKTTSTLESCKVKRVRKQILVPTSDVAEEDNKDLKCPHCNETLKNSVSLTKHSQSCSLNKPYPCYTCGMHFYGPVARMSHSIESHPEKGQYMCYKCGRVFLYRMELDAHQDTHCSEEIVGLSCDVCGEELHDAKSRIQHVISHIGQTLGTCELCEKEIKWRSDVQKHKAGLCTLERKAVEIPTAQNGTVFQSSSTLIKSSSLGDAIVGHLCKLCGKIFRVADNLVTHQQDDHSLFVCIMCKSRFHHERSLMKHLHEQHYPKTTEELRYACNKCRKRFETEMEASLHEKMHIQLETLEKMKSEPHVTRSKSKGERSPLLALPNRGRISQSLMSDSIQPFSIRRNRPYPCYVCGKIYNDLCLRAAHIRSHIGENRFTCKTCGNKFTVKANFDSHMKTHF